MSAGYPLDKDRINVRAGALAVQVRDLFNDMAQFKTMLDRLDDTALGALGFSTTDISDLRGCALSFDALAKVANGQQAQASANDFLFFSKKFVGTN